METQSDQNADLFAQRVVNAWGINMTAGNGELLSVDFKALFEKACAYREAKQIADNRREFNMLRDEEATREQQTRSEFLEAYRKFHEDHTKNETAD